MAIDDTTNTIKFDTIQWFVIGYGFQFSIFVFRSLLERFSFVVFVFIFNVEFIFALGHENIFEASLQ